MASTGRIFSLDMLRGQRDGECELVSIRIQCSRPNVATVEVRGCW